VPDLIEPVLLFVAGTAHLPAPKRVACGADPTPRGALLWLYEYVFPPPAGAPKLDARRFLAGTPPKPRHVRLGRPIEGALECASVPGYNISFRAGRRIFFAKVAIGRKATPAIRRVVRRVLDDLAIRPAH
jgi:hypothetical protein